MNINIEIDGDLMNEAMLSSGAATEQQAVEAALRLLVQMQAQAGIRALRGKVEWVGDLQQMRESRTFE